MDKGSCVVDKGSSMVENRGCVINNRGSFNNRSSLDNWSSFNHRGRSNERSSSIVEAVVVSIGKAIVIPKRVRVSNQRVIINKGAVSLTMSSNTAVVVSISISFGFSITTFTGNNSGAGRSKSSRWKSSCKSSLQGATSCCDTVTGSQANNRGNWGNGSNGSNMVDKRGSMMDKRGSMKKRSSMNCMRNKSWCFNNSFDNWSVHNGMGNGKGKGSSSNYRSSSWGNKGSSSRKVKASVEDQLRISLSLTLMKTVDRLIAGTRKRSSIARCIVWSVQASIAIGSIVVQGIGFRLSQAERGYGENYDHALHNVYRTAVLRRVPC